MGVKISPLLKDSVHQIELRDLSGKDIAVDAMNTLYQFLSIIRQTDGHPLKDKKGRVTSHLNGLFYRTVNLVELNIRPVFIFDGKPPELKSETIKERKQIKDTATEKWLASLARGDYESARRHAQATSRFDTDMISDAKSLLSHMGIPFVQSPSEGEAQAAYMNSQGDVWATASRDLDSLLFNAEKFVRNLTSTGRRKLPRKQTYVEIKPELIYLDQLLEHLEITLGQLIGIGILIGTDFNEGVAKVGPKTALKWIKQYGELGTIIQEKNVLNDVPVDQIYNIFKNPEVTDAYDLKWRQPKREKLTEFLCEEHDFAKNRIENAIERLEKATDTRQSTMDRFF